MLFTFPVLVVEILQTELQPQLLRASKVSRTGSESTTATQKEKRGRIQKL